METLAYLHLELANEEPISTWESSKLFVGLDRQKLSTTATVHLLSITVALGVLGLARQASALVRQGDRGSDITALQQRLAELGYFQGNATGYFGPVTKEAVMSFQEAKGLTPDGVVGANTQAALSGQSSESPQSLNESSTESPQPLNESSTESLEPRDESSTTFSLDNPKDVLHFGDSGEQVSAIQKDLAAAGFSISDNGIFDKTTENTVREFQQAKGLKVDGIIGEQTKLALSESAKATPTPAPKKSSSFFENESAPLDPFTRSSDDNKRP
jgi:peptidoglycan hydrolase-like protein with peptidoglycan-binding domain